MNYDSNDGIIRVICNEFIKWSDRYKSAPSSWDSRSKGDFKFNYEYPNYTDEYKQDALKNSGASGDEISHVAVQRRWRS